MTHGIKKYDKNGRNHLSYCGKTITFNDNYSLDSKEINCTKCCKKIDESVKSFDVNKNRVIETVINLL